MEKTMKRLQQGFTLIELMIVVAIVGILAAIALPAYQDYVIRSKMSEAVAALAACKTSLSEYVSTKNLWPQSADQAGCSSVVTTYMKTLAVNDKGVIIATTQATGSKNGGSASDCILTLTAEYTALPDITGWSGTHSACDSKYVPSNFR
jgi:type IV pilus assembly protein PilA